MSSMETLQRPLYAGQYPPVAEGRLVIQTVMTNAGKLVDLSASSSSLSRQPSTRHARTRVILKLHIKPG